MIEIVTFQLRKDADPEQFKAFEAKLQTEFYYHQPGLERRTTAGGENQSYVCILHWDSAAAADAAATKLLVANDYADERAALVDPQSIEATRYNAL